MPRTGRQKIGPNFPLLGIAANIFEARIASGHTQESLGIATDLHRTEISLLERKQREPRLGTLLKIAASTGTTPESLAAGMRWIPTAYVGGRLVPGYWVPEGVTDD